MKASEFKKIYGTTLTPMTKSQFLKNIKILFLQKLLHGDETYIHSKIQSDIEDPKKRMKELISKSKYIKKKAANG